MGRRACILLAGQPSTFAAVMASEIAAVTFGRANIALIIHESKGRRSRLLTAHNEDFASHLHALSALMPQAFERSHANAPVSGTRDIIGTWPGSVVYILRLLHLR
jgi:hypothetical protein